jgi:hypothetical protein
VVVARKRHECGVALEAADPRRGWNGAALRHILTVPQPLRDEPW